MSDIKQSNEQRYYDTLRRIAKHYQTAEQLQRRAYKDWGLHDPLEALEYAYENIQQEAKIAIKGKRRPAA